MFARSLAALGLGVALIFTAPVSSFAQQARKPQAEQILKKNAKKAATEKKAAAKKTDKKAGQKTAGKKDKAEPEEDKPKGLFASLFGPPKTDAAKGAKPKKVVVAAKAEPAKRPVAKARAEIADNARSESGKSGGLWIFGRSTTPEVKPEEPKRVQPGRLAPVAPIQPVAVSAAATEIVKTGNNGELRSDNPVAGGGMMASVFGNDDVYLAETRALDNAYRNRENAKKKPFQVAEKWQPQIVQFSGYPRGTIVIDTSNHFLYLVEGMGQARRYGIAVGKDGLQYKGEVKVGDKQEWPRWSPTKEMQERDPKAYGRFKDGMPGGGMNPLGARAIYLYEGRKDTHLRIHGTIAPQTIGTNSSNGCFRMVNEHVIDLYRRVPVGANVVVL